MASVANLVRWEWFKLSRRWMPWVLLAVMVLFSQLVVWASVNGYQRTERQTGATINLGSRGNRQSITLDCRTIGATPPGSLPPAVTGEALQAGCAQWNTAHLQELQQLRNNFTIPGALNSALGVSESVGVFLLAILTASVIGTEYGWGTLRSVLAKGTGRWQVLGAKLLLMGLVLAVAFLMVMALAGASSAIASPRAGEGLAPTVAWPDVARTFGRMWVALLPYMALAALFSVLTGSAAAGIGISLAYQFGEQIGVAILINLVDWFHYVADYLPARNVAAWVQGGQSPGERGFFAGAAGTLPGPIHGLIVLLFYTLALGALAFWLFQRRDVKGAGGG